ncbi:hypothetical protein EFE42_05270 [Methanohalophilus sp. RSK]|uniref:hypothetical protein n=1 Tax=Methanohalophilus sp. RSK TaxID=2485783 RepID=UPI000F439F41|nr:hypothetical protein [Methanohalophilus sp. RSK]RNI14026.1 hypothetical protein EFE42_05270 [Methanohalophilus sp. RSK]
MGKKSIEILLAVGSVTLFAVMLILVHSLGMTNEGYGYVVSLMIFVLVVSVVGLKLPSLG